MNLFNFREKKMQRLYSYIHSQEDEALIVRPEYNSTSFLLSIYQYDAFIKFKIYHLKGHISFLQGIMQNKEFEISDIQCAKYNKGYGSILMMELLEFTKINGIEKITGGISIADSDHIDRLIYFYKKFNFSVSIFDYPEGVFIGNIELHL